MKIIAFTKHNPRFAEYRPEEEDAFRYNIKDKRIIAAVADGITRDPIGVKTLPDFDNKKRMKEAAERYPIPSPAKLAANLFCDSFIKSALNKKVDEKLIIESSLFANKKIWEKLNKDLKVDYLENDFAACVGSVGVIEDNNFYYGFIADCGICVFDINGRLKFKTKNEGPSKRIGEDIIKRYNTGFKQAYGRKIIRKEYRNNPLNPLSYGAFTGEENAACFIRTGQLQIEKGDRIVLYTDGMNNLLSQLSNRLNNLEGFIDDNLDNIAGAEATIVSILL